MGYWLDTWWTHWYEAWNWRPAWKQVQTAFTTKHRAALEFVALSGGSASVRDLWVAPGFQTKSPLSPWTQNLARSTSLWP